MECPTPKVTLLTKTELPLETVYALWDASKTENPLMMPEEVREKVPAEEVEKLFKSVIAQKIPIGEHIHFTFMLENVSISWREQAARHRIGTKPGPERLGVDISMEIDGLMQAAVIPNLAESSWWSQSMRIMDMSKFADKGAYRLPDTVRNHPEPEVEEHFHIAMKTAQDAYAWLVQKGIPMEDARDLIGLGAQHRISWDFNIGSLQHISGKRGCWILQLGLWGPVIGGMIDELVAKVHPVFREMITPPCLNGDDFTGCVYQEEVRRRYSGEDALPPCPLHLNHHQHPDIIFPLGLYRPQVDIPMKAEMIERANQYRYFWGRDPYSGTRLK